MKKLLVFAGAIILCSSLVFAAGPRTYQVTGPILEMKDDIIQWRRVKRNGKLPRMPPPK